MHAHLMQPAGAAAPAMLPDADTVSADLGLDALLDAMSGGVAGEDRPGSSDPLSTMLTAARSDRTGVREIVRTALLSPLTTPADIRYRQQVLADFRADPALLTELHRAAAGGLAAERRVWRMLSADRPGTVLHGAAQSLQAMLPTLRALQQLATTTTSTAAADRARSPGVRALLTACRRAFPEAWLADVSTHLRALTYSDAVRGSARLGPSLLGTDHRLRRRPRVSWLERLHVLEPPGLTLTIPERDHAGAEALGELRDALVAETAAVTADAATATRQFLRELRDETLFYAAVLRLVDLLETAGQQWCIPQPVDPSQAPDLLTATGLGDIGLAVRTAQPVVGNDLDASGRPLVVITGANSGGKSTFLRALGLAQLLLQAGLPVAATRLTATVVPAVFTHYRRQEDAELQRGKLDEELDRMSAIADRLRPGCLLLCNESFASTNDREGSAIARDILDALTDAGVRVAFVTHLHELPVGLYHDRRDVVLLRADREPDGSRSYRLRPAPPLPTGYAHDLYARIVERAGQPGSGA